MEDPSRATLMKYKKAELCTMVRIAMEERNRWEKEFYNLEKQYDELLQYKNEIRDKYIQSNRGLSEMEDWTSRLTLTDIGGNEIVLDIKEKK